MPLRSVTTLGVAVAVVAMVLALVPNAARATSPAKLIAFTRGGELWTMRGDGSQATRLTHTAPWEGTPAWSADGKTLAYSRTTHTGANYSAELWTMSSNGTGVHRLAFTEPASGWHRTWVDSLAFSPDGRSLAIADRVAKGAAFLTRVILVDLRTRRSAILFKADYDLDGIGVSFGRDSNRLLVNLLPTDVSGGAIESLNISTGRTTAFRRDGLSASFSPDGRRIALVRVWYQPESRVHVALATMGSSGTSLASAFVSPSPQDSGLLDEGTIAWDATSSRLAFVMNDSAWVLNLSTHGMVRTQRNVQALAWQR